MTHRKSNRRRRWKRFRQRKEGDQAEMVIMALADGDKSLAEIAGQFTKLERRFGYFLLAEEDERLLGSLEDDIRLLEGNGLLRETDGRYSLTSKGREAASKYLSFVAQFSRLVDRALLPETVSIIGLAVHFALATLKLAAGWLSGSIGLISDGTDTLLDGLSSVLVFLGLRFDKERYVNVLLVVLMLGVGASLVAEVIHRFLEPVHPEADLLSFFAIVTSGAVCLLLGQYQRYVGARSGSLSLISQSIDSRNHVIVAAGVTAGLVAAALNFGLLDTVVGLAVAVLILKSAFDLAAETLRALQGAEVDFSKYEPGVVERYRRHKQRQLEEWALYLIASKGPVDRAHVLSHAKEALHFGDVPVLRELRMVDDGSPEERVKEALETLAESGFVTPDDPLQATAEGKARIGEILRKRRHHAQRDHLYR